LKSRPQGIPFFTANGAEPPPVTMSQQELMLVLPVCQQELIAG
jgi:hypothetical protein